MKRKVLAALLCVSMTATLLTGCGKEKENNATNTDPVVEDASEEVVVDDTEAPAAPVAEMAEPEELPAEFAHLTFDGETDEGIKAVVQTEDVGDNDGGTYGLAETDVEFVYEAGAVGNCLALDGTYGIDLGLEATQTDAYTVSFWVNADRLSTFGPTLQMGYDMGKKADDVNDVTWLNVTQSEWGVDGAKIFPIVWSRNEASNAADGTVCFPWMYGFDNEIHGKKEWTMVTIVCSGEAQNSPVGTTTAGAQFYVNGVKMYDSQDNFTNNTYFEHTWDASLAPNIMKPGDGKTFESLFGINYWDTIFKGFVDDLFVYDTALTPGQVASLFIRGNADAETLTGDAEEVEAPIELPEITEDAAAIDKIGTTARDMGFWSDWSQSYELANGATKTIKLNNYSNATNNWCNYVLAFCNVETPGHSAPADVAGYAEYAVTRADSFAWGVADDASFAFEYTASWGDDWAAFAEMMKDAEVTIKLTRNDSTISVDATFVAADGTEYTQQGTMTTETLTAAEPCYFFVTGEGAYVEILSVE